LRFLLLPPTPGEAFLFPRDIGFVPAQILCRALNGGLQVCDLNCEGVGGVGFGVLLSFRLRKAAQSISQ